MTNFSRQVAAKAKELAETLLAGGEFQVGNYTVTNSYFINNVRATDELGRLILKSGRGESTDIELKQLLEDEASKIADCWVVDVLEMEQEKCS